MYAILQITVNVSQATNYSKDQRSAPIQCFDVEQLAFVCPARAPVAQELWRGVRSEQSNALMWGRGLGR